MEQRKQARVYLVIGGAWGDEGKGKVATFYGKKADLVIRATGGANAGHTIYVNDQKIALHLIPGGIINPGVKGLIGQGVVVDLQILHEEIEKLEELVPDIRNRLKISGTASVLMPYHKELDEVYENLKEHKIGTTKKGIGPAYEDKIKRVGLKMYDLLRPVKELEEMIKSAIKTHIPIMESLNKLSKTELRKYIHGLAMECKEYANEFASMIVNGHNYVSQFKQDSSNVIVVEGAQAIRLSIENGDYPNVTSSDSNTLGTLSGAHLNHKDVTEVINCFKAHFSRVGNGPFPTEFDSHINSEGKLCEYCQCDEYEGDKMREMFGEYGATTKRPRRVGAFDAVLARLSAEVSGADYLCINCIDAIGLWGEEQGDIKIATHYYYGGKIIDYYPDNIELTNELPTPQYIVLTGGWVIPEWVTTYAELPQKTKIFIGLIEKLVGVPVKYIGIGPHNEDMIVRTDV